MKTMYEVLNVSVNATASEVKKAYREKCLQIHPDCGGDTATFQEVADAYRVLSDQTLRAEYDRQLNENYELQEEEQKESSFYEGVETEEPHSGRFVIVLFILRFIFHFACYTALFYLLREIGRFIGAECIGYFIYCYIMYRIAFHDD